MTFARCGRTRCCKKTHIALQTPYSAFVPAPDDAAAMTGWVEIISKPRELRLH
ncbi:hypothetical protein CES86_0242 [Brucella lupini]|uniref:Uncharacterized protein n=1 Tax=Brucella lupini TaxID=255457 RepID=A0A256GYM3_9HYPH|nr:hypothetical protein CES86_0242 [Brucella lupini]